MMSELVRLLVVTGTRADFGLWIPVLREAASRPGVEPVLLATAMHLDDRFGSTIAAVRAGGWRVAAEVPCTPVNDGRAEMAAAIGQAMIGMAPVIEREAPTWLLVLGDRGEQLAAAIAAAHLGVPVAHLHGGEVTRGVIDDMVRDLLTRIAALHLAATAEAAVRLAAMGEQRWRILQVGAPGLDLLASEARGDLVALRARLGLAEGPYLLVVQHPETVGVTDPAAQLDATIGAVAATGLPAVALFPNADAGGRAMIERLHAAPRSVTVLPSLPRPDYVTLLAGAAALVGNSSSAIIEAPLLRVPAVNVGSRQEGRTRGDNVVDVAADRAAIEAAIARVLDPRFRENLSGMSPYGDGSAAPRIVDALLERRADPGLLNKAVGAPLE